MTATGQDATVWQREAITLVFAVSSDEVIDLTTAENLDWTDAHGTTKTDGAGVTAVDETTVEVRLTPADLDRPPRSYAHELRVTTIGGDPVTVAVGMLRVQ